MINAVSAHRLRAKKRAGPPERGHLLYGGAEPRFRAIYENFLRRGCCLDVEQ